MRFLFRVIILLFLLPPAGVTIAQQVTRSAPPAVVELTNEEQAWLVSKHTVRARVADYPPYMFRQPVPAGISVDHLTSAARRFGFKVEFLPDTLGFPAAVQDVSGPRQHYDLLLTFTRTPEREQQFAITADYLTAPWVVYARQDSPYIVGLESLGGKVVAGEKGFVITNRLKADYPAIRILEVEKSADALIAVATGKADAYVGNLANASFLIKEIRLDNLMVAAPTPYGINTQAMAIRKDWPELAGLINKSIVAMTAEERNAISQKWGTVEMRPRVDYKLVWQIAGAASLVILAFLYWNRKLAREIAIRQGVEAELTTEKKSLQQAHHALEGLNQSLEDQVRNRTSRLSEALEFNAAIILNSPIPIGVYASNGRCVMANEAYAQLVGATRNALLAQNFHSIPTWQEAGLLQHCLCALSDHSPQRGELKTVSSFGKSVWIEYRILPAQLNAEEHLLIQFFDLTEHKRLEEELRNFAFHDALTQLPNRRLLVDRIDQALRLSKRNGDLLAVIFLDLNNFKHLNDAYGHDVGDQLLIKVANRLRRSVRDSDTVARLGGDEFVVLLESLGAEPDKAMGYVNAVAAKIALALNQEYVLDDILYQGSASLGIKLFNGEEDNTEQILKDADAAMYLAKKGRASENASG